MKYIKLKTKLNIVHPEEGPTEYIKYGVGEGLNFQGIKYTDFSVSEEAKSLFRSLIPVNERKHFHMSLMTINRAILPHTDSNTKTAINWYIHEGGYETYFCEPKHDAKPFKLPTQTDGCVYSFEDTTFMESFSAKDGDIYVLDVTKTHCVVPKAKECTPRVALNMATNLPFKNVVSLLGDQICIVEKNSMK
tara:strand:- start:1427 stop:1999 length:573 start_codon:yes stop_codon:yes gene_type:complete